MRSSSVSSDQKSTEQLQQTPLPAKTSVVHTSSVQIPANTDDIFLLSFSPSDLQKTIQTLLVPTGYEIGPVIWEDAESDVVVHLDKLRFALKPGLILFELTLEADGTGLVPMVIPFKIGNDANTASLIISTEHLPRGEQLMAHRWGEIVQEHLWFALLEAGEQLKAAKFTDAAIKISGIYTDGESVFYLYSEPVTADDIDAYAKAIKAGDIPPRDESLPPTPVNLEPPTTGPPDDAPPYNCDHPNEPLPVLGQLWREWIALLRQTLCFAKKLAWVVVQLSKKFKKK